MEVEYVLARYDESIAWIQPIEADVCVINKGPALPKGLNCATVQRPNYGRESEAYLSYILTNYDNLPEVIVFSQARIWDHVGADDPQFLVMCAEEAGQKGISIPQLKSSTDPVWGFSFNYCGGHWFMPSEYKRNVKLVFGDWFKTYIRQTFPTFNLRVYPNAIFGVRRDLVLARPRSYYQTLLEQVNWSQNPVECHFMERSWYYVFVGTYDCLKM